MLRLAQLLHCKKGVGSDPALRHVEDSLHAAFRFLPPTVYGVGGNGVCPVMDWWPGQAVFLPLRLENGNNLAETAPFS